MARNCEFISSEDFDISFRHIWHLYQVPLRSSIFDYICRFFHLCNCDSKYDFYRIIDPPLRRGQARVKEISDDEIN